MQYKFEFASLESLVGNLASVKPAVVRQAVRAAIVTATAPLIAEIKRSVHTDESGALRRSIGRKVKTYASSGTVTAAIGPRSGFKTTYETNRGKKVLRNPTKYAHLVEGGTKAHAIPGWKQPHPGAKAKPFIEPVYKTQQARVQEVFAERFIERIEALINK